MKLNSLKPAPGSVRSNKRLGRGQGSGAGGHSTRGIKGARSRSGFSNKRNFEGGQMPLQMRLPKRGFKNSNRRYKGANPGEYAVFNLDRLSEIAEKYQLNHIDPQTLYSLGYTKKTELVKILADGEMKGSFSVTAHRFSSSAKEAINAAGGKAFYCLKTNQIQGIAHAYNLERIDSASISRNFKHISDSDLVHLVNEGSLSMKLDVHVHKVSEEAQEAITAQGGQVTVLA